MNGPNRLSALAVCPQGKRVVGGGWRQSSQSLDFDANVIADGPTGGGDGGQAWEAEVRVQDNPVPPNLAITVFAICANVG